MAHKPNQTWPQSKRIEVVTTYLILGKAPMVEAVTGVSAGVIRQWKLQPWWKELEDELRQEEEIELDAKLKKILDKSLDAVSDRIENGEYVYDTRSGKVIRRPVALKDVHKVTVDFIDKRQLIQGKPTRRVENIQTTQDHLKLLAEQFKAFVNGPAKQERIIDAEVTILEEPK